MQVAWFAAAFFIFSHVHCNYIKVVLWVFFTFSVFKTYHFNSKTILKVAELGTIIKNTSTSEYIRDQILSCFYLCILESPNEPFLFSIISHVIRMSDCTLLYVYFAFQVGSGILKRLQSLPLLNSSAEGQVCNISTVLLCTSVLECVYAY